MADPDRDRHINVAGTWHVLAGAAGAGSARVLFVSNGGAIYGDGACASEEAPIAPASYYGVHKFTAERHVALGGLPYAIARLTNVYGPRQRGDLKGRVVAVFSERLRAQQPVTIHGSGDQRRDFIHASDVIAALLVMGETCRNGLGTWDRGGDDSQRAASRT